MNSNSPPSDQAPAKKRAAAPAYQRRKKRRGASVSYERRLLILSLAAGMPGVILSLVVLWADGYSAKVWWTCAVLVVSCWLGFSFALHTRVVRTLQTVANLLAALREGDYSMRARHAPANDSLAEVMREVNELGETLREQRVGAMEATAL
ncbi:MAG TPA: hypothetical protein VM870_00675, partial [Pyrinomonadaceae bacterium]|nr:hypothetical protein [Pyrinomonadaceae bacterium]